MDTLAARIRERIELEGPITFAAFMQMALYYQDHGYYTSRKTDIGRSGDYYTSPHLHPAFGAMLGRQVEEIWEIMGRPGGFQVVEIGSGRGYLCMDMLDYLRGSGTYDNLSYTIVEINPFFAERQKELLKGHEGKVRWVSSLGDVGQIAGCVLSNEVLDALPVHLVEMRDELMEIYVSLANRGLREEAGPPSTEDIGRYLGDFSVRLSHGYRTEVSLALTGWLKEVSDVLSEGFLITIDYGYPAPEYYSEERSRGTLMCYHRHMANEDPLSNVGKQDITAHVNFTALMKYGEALGLRPVGFCRQGPYLVALGIDGFIADLFKKSPDYEFEVSRIKGLIMPGTMGESHSVMVQHRGRGSPVLRGFSLKNQLKRL
jgi:SAM-dependent MidA family methyltransferase